MFESYTIQSASPKNTINLEVPIQALQRALKSAIGAISVGLRLTKKDNVPLLSLTIVTKTFTSNSKNAVAIKAPSSSAYPNAGGRGHNDDPTWDDDLGLDEFNQNNDNFAFTSRERETVITQDVPVKVLPMQAVEGLHEPRTQEPDVHIYLPSLAQVKSISERFTKLALTTGKATTSSSNNANNTSSANNPRLELSANMHSSLRIGLKTDTLSVSSVWTGLMHPELDPTLYEGGSQDLANHPSTRMKELGGPDGQNEAGWSKVRIDAKDWSRVLSVGRLSARVIACFMNETGLILYVYLPNEDDSSEESCLTVSPVGINQLD